MKKFVRLLSLVLVLLLAVCVFVACNDTPDDPDDGPDDGTTPGGDDEPADTTQKFTATFKFIDPNGNELAEDIERGNITYNGEAFVPNGYQNVVTRFADYVLIGWDSDGDGEADDGYKHVKKNITINAVFRVKEMFTVKFYDTPTTFQEVTVKEGDAIDVSGLSCKPEIGKVFKQWVNADSKDATTLECAKSNASFVAQFAKINSVIPMVGKNTITVDGIKDEAYKNATYLPINEERHADREGGTYNDQIEDRPAKNGDTVKGIETSWITADAWLLWDGDYVYMLVEVSDKTLSYRNTMYINLNYNAWLNDNVEAYFNFEQNATASTNKKKLGIDALGYKLFANSIAVYGDNSTHYADMTGAARSALGYYKNGVITKADAAEGLTNDKAELERTDSVGVQYAGNTTAKNYSHRIELKFVAKTEGVPDKANFPVDDNGRLPADYVLEDGKTVVPAIDVTNSADTQDPTKVDMKFYRFTEGEKLQVGSFVRFNLQIGDLMVLREDMMKADSGFYEGDPTDMEQMKSGSFYDKTGKAFRPPFVPAGQTQYELADYVAFSLGDTNTPAAWEVYELKGTEPGGAKMYDANGEEIVQGAETITVEIAK